jgi:hypothetical protein
MATGDIPSDAGFCQRNDLNLTRTRAPLSIMLHEAVDHGMRCVRLTHSRTAVRPGAYCEMLRDCTGLAVKSVPLSETPCPGGIV